MNNNLNPYSGFSSHKDNWLKIENYMRVADGKVVGLKQQVNNMKLVIYFSGIEVATRFGRIAGQQSDVRRRNRTQPHN